MKILGDDSTVNGRQLRVLTLAAAAWHMMMSVPVLDTGRPLKELPLAFSDLLGAFKSWGERMSAAYTLLGSNT